MNRVRLVTVLFALLLAGAASAATELAWSPDLQVVAPGAAGRVSVVTADSVRLRTIDVVIEADPDLLLHMQASPGSVFDGVPCMIWEESEILAPGRWHGFAVIIGAECETAGPGELLRWDFTAGPAGSTLVTSVAVKLYAPDGALLEESTLGHATILVNAVADTPPTPVVPALQLAPNPFNPRVAVTVSGVEQGAITVHDLRGRTVARLCDGAVSGSHAWDGRDDTGAPAPSGTYFFVLRTRDGQRFTARGAMVR